jgi:hypothetical protein
VPVDAPLPPPRPASLDGGPAKPPRGPLDLARFTTWRKGS